jgi:tellurite resistance-related uncharacterized protein
MTKDLPLDPALRPHGLPADARPYSRTREFDEHSIPAALTLRHNTKPGVWAAISVLEGRLAYVEPETGAGSILSPGEPGLAAPQVWHCVTPVGQVRFFVQFYAAATAETA